MKAKREPKVRLTTLTPAEQRKYLIKNSSCRVSLYRSGTLPVAMDIVFSGPVALIPSLKNGKGFKSFAIASSVKARLQAMTSLFRFACPYPVSFGATTMFVQIVLADRPHTFDEDNGLAAVRDWLEPSEKRGKDRGWGVGVVQDDRFILGACAHCRRVGPAVSDTTIRLRRWEDVRAEYVSFLQNIVDVKVGALVDTVENIGTEQCQLLLPNLAASVDVQS